jgi:citrate lyase subunit beta/citryl-CoA lyase
MADYSPRRSMLFMPASNARALEKAKSLPCDGVIFDLEDAVAPDMKEAARQQVAAALAAGGYGTRELVVRINGLDTDWWRADLAALAGANPAAILLPKMEDPHDLERVEEELAWHRLGDVKIWAMLETPKAFLKAEDIATATEKLNCLVIGTNDLVKELRAKHTPGREPVLAALGSALLIARAYGLDILDGVYNNFRDEVGFASECEQGAAMGFDGKTLIHPAQIGAANKAFSPSEEELVEARAIVAAFEAAKNDGKGVVTVGGKMIEELHVKEAERMIAVAEATAT